MTWPCIEFTAPVRIESEMNRRDHWAKRKRRFDEQRRTVAYSWPKWTVPTEPVPWPYRGYGPGPFVVTLTRIGPRKLDSDNLASGFKAARDQIAFTLGIDDGSERLTWKYEQERGKPREYAIRVRIQPILTPDE